MAAALRPHPLYQHGEHLTNTRNNRPQLVVVPFLTV